MDYMEAFASWGSEKTNSSEMKAWKDAEAALMEDEKEILYGGIQDAQ